MKRIFGIIVILITMSCGDDVRPVYDIYNDWQWVKSTFDERGRPITSQDVDSTHYFCFTTEGELIVKNDDKEIISEYDVVFEKVDEFKTFRIKDSEIVLDM